MGIWGKPNEDIPEEIWWPAHAESENDTHDKAHQEPEAKDDDK